jgi:carbamoyl-phosphate synthase large subunit
MTTVLITGIGGDIAQSVAKLVRERFPAFRLVGADMGVEHGGSLFVDTLRIVPAASAPDYTAALLDIVASEGVDHVVPMSEPELDALLPLIEKREHTNWITAGARVIAAGIDKLETAQALAHLGIPTPWTSAVATGKPRELPCILKERFGSGSRGVYIVRDDEDLRYLTPRHPGGVFQELVGTPDSEVTCAVYRTAEARVATLQMRRRLVGGFTGWAETIADHRVGAMCEQVAEGLQLQGAMNIQLRLTVDGPRIFEINPRYSSTALMRAAIGFNDVGWAFDELQGTPVTFPRIPTGTVIVRTQGAAVMRRPTDRMTT